jgi:hypothetical protein
MLTESELTIFRTALLAETDPELVGYRTNGQTPLIVAWYSKPATPDFWVWRTRVTQDEIMQNGFDWVRVDNLTVGKARIWEWLFDNSEQAINPSKDNVRAGIAECWKGTAADIAVRDAVLVHCRRLCTRVERLFATGQGTTVSPGLATVTALTDQDVSSALNA